MGEKSQLLLLYVIALVPGIVLTAVGVFGHWESAPDASPGRTAAPTSETAREIWQARAPVEATPAATTCTDLRALFGLGEKLTEPQRRYLQERC